MPEDTATPEDATTPEDTATPDDQGSPQSEPAEFSNRAARRKRGKGKDASSEGFGKVQDFSRRNAVQGPRQWSLRRSG
jgi:hypothetical protein